MIIQQPPGFSLLQSLIVVAAIASLMTYTVQQHRSENEQARARALGQEIATYNNAIRAYIAENTQEIISTTPLGSTSQITFQKLKSSDCTDDNKGTASDHFLPCDFPSTSRYSNLSFTATTVEVIDDNLLHPKIKATTTFDSLSVGNQLRPDLAGLAAMTAMGHAIPNATSQRYNPGGIASTHASIEVLADAQIRINSSNGEALDEWLRTDGSNNMQASISFNEANPDEQREIVGSDRLRNNPGENLILGQVNPGGNDVPVFVDGNFSVDADSYLSISDAGQIVMTSGKDIYYQSGTDMAFSTTTNEIALEADDYFLNQSRDIQFESAQAIHLTSGANIQIHAEQAELNFDANQGMNLSSDNSWIDFNAVDNNHFSAGDSLFLRTENAASLYAEAQSDASYIASQNLEIQAANSSLIALNNISLQGDTLAIVSQQHNIDMQAGQGIDLLAHQSLTMQANQALILESASDILFKDNGAGLAIDDFTISAQSADITAQNTLHYQATNHIQQQSVLGGIDLQAAQQLKAQAQNLRADLSQSTVFDIEGGDLDLYGSQGVGLYAAGENALYGDHILIATSGSAATAPYDRALNLLSDGSIITTTDSDYSVEADGLALSAKDLYFNQAELFEIEAEQSLSLNADNFYFGTEAGDTHLYAGHNFTTSGPLFEFFASHRRMTAYGDNSTRISANETLSFDSKGWAEVKAEEVFHLDSGNLVVNYTGDIGIHSPHFTAQADLVGIHGTVDVHLQNQHIDLEADLFTVYAGNSVNLTAQDQTYNVHNLRFDTTNIDMKSNNNIQVNIDKPIIMANLQNDILAGDYIEFISEDDTTNIGSDQGNNYVIAERIHIGTERNQPANTRNINFTANNQVFQSEDLEMTARNNFNAKAGWARFGNSESGGFNIHAKNELVVETDISFNINTTGGDLSITAPKIKLSGDKSLNIIMLEGHLSDMQITDCTGCESKFMAEELRRIHGDLNHAANHITMPAIQQANNAVDLALDSENQYGVLQQAETEAYTRAQNALAQANAVYAQANQRHLDSYTPETCPVPGAVTCSSDDPPVCTTGPTTYRDCSYYKIPAPASVPNIPLPTPSHLEPSNITPLYTIEPLGPDRI